MAEFNTILPTHRLWVDNVSDITELIEKKLVNIGNIIYVASADAHYKITGNDANGITGYELLNTTTVIKELTKNDVSKMITNAINTNNQSVYNNLNSKVTDVSISVKNYKLVLDVETEISSNSIIIPEATTHSSGILSKEDKLKIDSAINSAILKLDNQSVINLDVEDDSIILPIYSKIGSNNHDIVTSGAIKNYVDNIVNNLNVNFNLSTPSSEKYLQVYTSGNTTYIKTTDTFKSELANSIKQITTGKTSGTILVDSKEVKVAGWDELQNSINSTSTIIDETISSALSELTYNDTPSKYKFVTSVSQENGKITVTKSEVDIKNSCNIVYIDQVKYDDLLLKDEILKNTIYIIIDVTGEPIRIYIGELLFADKKEDNTAFPYNFPMIF